MHEKLKRLIKDIEAVGEAPTPIHTAELIELEMIAEDLALCVAEWTTTLVRDMGSEADVKEGIYLLCRQTTAVAYWRGNARIRSCLVLRSPRATAMTASASRILSDALSLSPVEPAELIDELLHSFDPPQDGDMADVWKTEAESRIDAHDAGRLSADSAEAVFARINKR